MLAKAQEEKSFSFLRNPTIFTGQNVFQSNNGKNSILFGQEKEKSRNDIPMEIGNLERNVLTKIEERSEERKEEKTEKIKVNY